MNTKLVSQWNVGKSVAESLNVTKMDEQLVDDYITNEIRYFIKGDKNSESSREALFKLLTSEYQKIESELNSERWVELTNDIYFDKKAGGCWVIKTQAKALYKEFNSGTSLAEVNAHLNIKLKDQLNLWEIPSKTQLMCLTGLKGTEPFGVVSSRPKAFSVTSHISYSGGSLINSILFGELIDAFRSPTVLFAEKSKVKVHEFSVNSISEHGSGCSVPFLKLPKNLTNPKQLFIEFINKGLTPLSLENSREYHTLLSVFHRNMNELPEAKLYNYKEVLLPDIGADVADVTEILVSIGDYIVEDQNVISIEGDKASMDVPSSCSGIVEQINISVGDSVSEGALIITLKVDKKVSIEEKVALKKEAVLIAKDILQKEYKQSLDNIVNDSLLNEDHIRADLAPYHQKMLEDTEQGHWSLWQDELDIVDTQKIELKTALVACDPNSSIVNGVVGIDFGTKSTVVVYQKDNDNIHPMRIGTGDLSTQIQSFHYENPTIMEFKNLDAFIEAYDAKANKPYTRWQDLTISHTAQNAMMGSESNKFNTFLAEIKQWAGDKNRKLKIVGQQGKIIDLPPFLELTDTDFNPIEIYAYYLGLYINNLNNGIFMDYILSFPVTYEMPVRDKIIESFEKGLMKSLPEELGSEALSKLNVTKGASEPAAYALMALTENKFEPEGDERVFYGVFDFGGGTTDFDFGLFREATGKKERRYDYVIEHFGANGDKFLGGENLLELLAFEIFKKNKNALLAKNVQFEKHPEKDEFAGSEVLLSHSQEAKTNTKQLCIALRPFWEEHEGFSFDASGELNITLTDINGVQHTGFALDVDEDELKAILASRIERGVVNFFNALRLAFSNSQQSLQDVDKVNIFLAGNASQSSFVQVLFDKYIALENEAIGLSADESHFILFAPLGSDKNDVEKPTGKTGVAFGLVESRKGGCIKVIDNNVQDNDIRFKFYLGESRKKRFNTVVDRETPFGQWVEFIDASDDVFELYYTEQPAVTTSKIAITDSSIKKKIIKLEFVDEDAMVHVRIASPTEMEYVIAYEGDIDNNQYLSNINTITLS